MVRSQSLIIEGVLVLTVTLLLATRPAEAAGTNCTGGECMHSGVCPDTDVTPCNCSASDYVGDTCENAVCTSSGSECLNGGTCNTTGTPAVCSCGDYKGKTCADECEANGDCGSGGTCNTDDTHKTCTCATGYGGPQCAVAPKCTDDATCENCGTCNKTSTPFTCSCATGYSGDTCADEKSGATLVQVSLMSLVMSLIVSVL